MSEQYTPNFNASEFGAVPYWGHDRLRCICHAILQPMRNRFGKVKVTSGYRDGSKGQHGKCGAVDIHCPDANMRDVWDWLYKYGVLRMVLPVDQIILYIDSAHIHVSSVVTGTNRHVALMGRAYTDEEYRTWSGWDAFDRWKKEHDDG